jgi:hypothetical protein
LTRLDEPEAAELIERHIEFVDRKGRAVHLAEKFVKHFITRSDGALPLVTGICTMPLVLPNGSLLTGPGLLRHLNTVFRVPQELLAVVPTPEECTPARVANAMRFLTHEWLIDVATDYAGRCALIAYGLSIIERHLLPMRPAFFVSAGKRGGGKTTSLNMVSMAALGQLAAAAAWSPNEEERRKALFSYFLEDVPNLVWDNLDLGSTISSPSIEKSLTAELYTDRILGVTQHKIVPVTTIQAFNGNNIAPRGDLASRALRIYLDVDRPDPENRNFKHPDPIGWTRKHRLKILRAFYIILLGNPRRKGEWTREPETRFKEWWDLVGFAVEYGAKIVAEQIEHWTASALPSCPPKPISFKEMFLEGEAGDDENAGLAGLLAALRQKFPFEFQAREVAKFLEPEGYEPTDAARDMFTLLVRASGRLPRISSESVSSRLKKLVNAPVRVDHELLVLRYQSNNRDAGSFNVKTLSESPND